MPGITHIDGLKNGRMNCGIKNRIVHNGQKIGGSIKTNYNPEIEDEAMYGSNLNRLKQSLKSMHIASLPKVKGGKVSARKGKYINF